MVWGVGFRGLGCRGSGLALKMGFAFGLILKGLGFSLGLGL